jgi:hypothetical protein
MLGTAASLILATAFAVLAADKNVNESCFLAIEFTNGNTASVQLSNGDNREQTVNIERHSASGRLLDNVKKAVPAGGNTEVRMDLSSASPEFGWIRVLSKGKGVSASTTLEVVDGDTLQSIPQEAVFRRPELTKRRFSALPHRWTFDGSDNLGFLMYFVNLSEYPVQAAMCQDDYPGCTNPTLPYTVAPMASISFPIDQSRRYTVVESTPGYSVATALRLTEGAERIFGASSCIKFEGSTSCAPQPLPKPRATTKFVSPIEQQLNKNVEASRSSPAMAAAHPSGTGPSPEELAEMIKNGNASKCVIVTEPPGAEIYIDGFKAGVTPLVFALLKKGDAPRTIEVRMNGYRTIEKHLVPDGQLILLSSNLEKQ